MAPDIGVEGVEDLVELDQEILKLAGMGLAQQAAVLGWLKNGGLAKWQVRLWLAINRVRLTFKAGAFYLKKAELVATEQ